jgi:tetratricopeptide (TPR) repeat protein
MRTVLAFLLLSILATASFANTPEQDAVFTKAANLNRAGNAAEAYLGLKALEDAGYRNREMDFEIGWSLLGMGRAGACVPRLERYEQTVPGRALTSEFLGRCHLLLRDYDKAEARLREAIARDPGARQRVEIFLLQAQLGRGEKSAARYATARRRSRAFRRREPA